MSSIKVVHVDDDEDFLDLASRFMETADEEIQIISASSTKAAYQILDDEEVDCIVSDYDMPETDGLEFLREIREEYPNMPFILFTGKGSEEIASEAVSAGVTDYLQKQGIRENYRILANRIRNAVEKEKTRKALKENKKKFESLFRNANDAIFIMDKEEFIECNEKTEEIFGCTKEQIIGSKPYRFSPQKQPDGSDSKKKAIEKIQAALKGETQEFDWVHTKADGTKFDAKVSLNKIELDGNELIQAIVRDVTEEKEEKKLLERREKKTLKVQKATRTLFQKEDKKEIAEAAIEAAKNIFEIELVGINVLNSNGNLEPIKTTEKAYETFENGPNTYSNEDSIVWETYEENKSKLINDTSEIERNTPVGSSIIIPIEDYGIMVLSSEEKNFFNEEDLSLGEILALAIKAAMENVEFEQILKKERNNFAALFKNIPDPTVMIETQNGQVIIKDVNPAFENVFGFKEEEVKGEPIDKYVVPEEKMEEAKNINKKAKTGKEVSRVVKRKTAKGKKDFLLRSVIAPHDVGYAIYTDITEQKNRERRINKQKERLEKFADVLSHDLRNPLNVAKGYIDFLDEKEEVKEIENALNRIEDIIESTLEMAHHGGEISDKTELNVSEIAKEAWKSIQTEESTLEINSDFKIQADKKGVFRIFENLFSNAVEYGGKEIKVETGAITEENSKKGFYIQNNGEKIPENEADKIFEHGYSTKDSTGLGLSIVKSIVEAHGWEISLVQDQLSGPRFEIRTD
jgi:PAS domain S-box-containing protein